MSNQLVCHPVRDPSATGNWERSLRDDRVSEWTIVRAAVGQPGLIHVPVSRGRRSRVSRKSTLQQALSLFAVPGTGLWCLIIKAGKWPVMLSAAKHPSAPGGGETLRCAQGDIVTVFNSESA